MLCRMEDAEGPPDVPEWRGMVQSGRFACCELPSKLQVDLMLQNLMLCQIRWGIAYLLLVSCTQAAAPLELSLKKIGAEIVVRDGVITDLKADCSSFESADFDLIASVKTLKNLSLSGKTIDDVQFRKLAALTNLEAILLNNAQMSDDGFRHFQAFQQLKRLSLFHQSRDREDFNGSGLAHLKLLPELRRLTFAGATTGDEYLEAVAQLTQLEEFSEWHNWETREGLRHLQKLPRLKALKVGQRLTSRGRSLAPSLDDAALQVIAEIKSLERLEIQEARLTSAGLEHLSQLPHLKQLKIHWVQTPDGAIAALQKNLPAVKIDWTPLSAEEAETLLGKKLRLEPIF